MLVIPIQTKGHRADMLLVILGKDNLKRMQRADPAQIPPEAFAKVVRPRIFVCYEEDDAEMNRYIQMNDIRGLAEYLNRGFEYRPDLGDHDRGPESIHDLN